MANWILSFFLSAVVGGSTDCTLVHFTATWCEPCKQIQPALEQMQREGWTVQSIDIEREPSLVKQFRVENLPTVVILCRQQEVDRLVGAAPYEQLQRRATRAAARNQNGSQYGDVSQSASTAPDGLQQKPAPPISHHSLENTALPAPGGPIVRGQSPGLTAFPMLASLSTDAASANLGEVQSAPDQRPVESTTRTSDARETNTASAAGSVLSTEQAISRAAAATVRIRVDEGNTTAYGTGTIVDVHGNEALILTCGHLFRDMHPQSQLTIDLFPGTPQEVKLPSQLIDFKAEGEDIGLLSFRLPVAIEPVPLLARGIPLQPGSQVFSFGCDHGANPTRRDTRITRINRYLGADNIEIQGAPAVGRSGGGLFDLQGRLIGVCNAANAADDEGIYAAADVVYTQIERLGLTHLFTDSSSTPPANDHQSTQLGGKATAVKAQPAVATANWQRIADDSLPGPQASTQVICIVRDTGGSNQVVTINSPSPQLLELIHQAAFK